MDKPGTFLIFLVVLTITWFQLYWFTVGVSVYGTVYAITKKVTP